MLGRYCSASEVVFGTVVSGRPAELEGMERLVGLLINTLPLRVQLSESQTFWQTVAEIQTRQFKIREFEYASLADIQRECRLPPGVPLFDTIVNFGNQPANPAGLQHSSELQMQDLGSSDPTHYPLSLIVGQGQEQVYLRITYRERCFANSTVASLLADAIALLRSAASGQVRTVGDLTQSLQAVRPRSAPVPAKPVTSTLQQLFDQCAKQAAPHDVAIVSHGRETTFHQLIQLSDHLAARLRQAGVKAETPVGLLLPRSHDSVVAMLGILKSGGMMVPLDPSSPAERLRMLCDDAAIQIVVTRSELTKRSTQINCKPICLDEILPEVESVVIKNEGQHVPCHVDQAAYLLYTSGSSGQPKGVVGTHRGLINRLQWMWDKIPFRDGERVAHKTSLNFVDSLWEVFGPLLVGTPIVILSNETLLDVPNLMATMRRYRVTRLVLVPSLLRSILKASEPLDLDLPDGQLWTSSGEALTPDVVELFRSRIAGGRLLNLYGSTEVAADVTCYEATGLPAGALRVPIGKPIDHVQLYILDRELRPLPPGVAGEIYIGGDYLARGYWKQAALTAEYFVPDPFDSSPGARLYRTGDLARYDDDGNVEYLGRRDEMIKLRGIRIEPREIEAALRRHPLVLEATAYVESNRDDATLVACVVLAKQGFNDESELRRFLRRSLPEYLVPSVFRVVDKMPLGPTGKFDHQRMRHAELTKRQPAVISVGEKSIQQRIGRVWAELLDVDYIDPSGNFFDVGGHSLLLLRLRTRLSEELGHDFRLTDLVEHPTIESMAIHAESIIGTARLQQESPTREPIVSRDDRKHRDEHVDFAVIGMSGRFPQSPDLASFWDSLCAGRECRTLFSDAELAQQGLGRRVIDDARHVKSGFVLDDIDQFDASFFGFTPREAEILDPQHRLALECAWEALENAGYDPTQYEGKIGFFAGATMSGYLMNNVLPMEGLVNRIGYRQAVFGSVPDYLVTRVSYKLNLKGPSCFVQTACSTSLVAVHLACQSLRNGEADLVLAGGVSLIVPQRTGYLYEQGGMESPDGRCYAFDSRACGTVFGSGAGMVALKRLDEAIRDGDHIDAVIKGTAINNDGSLKVGFTAPSVAGQVDVIRAALENANVPPTSISYVETHGTGTEIGDPIEIAALNKAYAAHSGPNKFCAIGSLKPNIGHLDAAAGISALVKVVLSLQHQQLPPSINYESPNPKIDFDNGPLFVNTTLRPWPRRNGPRRAGVSSFGFGGTNAHVIVEEPPSLVRSRTLRSRELLILSARTATALDSSTKRLAAHLRQHPELSLADVAYTLQVGRSGFSHRRALVCQDVRDAMRQLEDACISYAATNVGATREPPIVFMFPGQGVQQAQMTRQLYREEAEFRATVDECCDFVSDLTGMDLREILYPPEERVAEMNHRLRRTSVTQLALFVVEVALARLWMSWGIRPDACIGHSIGEYVAAHLAGVFSLEDALRVVAMRGRLMEQMPEGAMLAVPLAADDLASRIGQETSIAAVNAPAACVISAAQETIKTLQQRFVAEGLPCTVIRTSHAFHSPMMDPAVEPFVRFIETIPRETPTIPYISNVTGEFASAKQIGDANYWGQQLRKPVQFSAGIQTLLADSQRYFLEVGPGQTLSQLARRHMPPRSDRVVSSFPQSNSDLSEISSMLQALGRLWVQGSCIDWKSFHRHEKRRRVVLPGYPFERNRYWVQPPRHTLATAKQMLARQIENEMSDCFFVPSWTRKMMPVQQAASSPLRVLVFTDGSDLSRRLENRLFQDAVSVQTVVPGSEFKESKLSSFAVRPGVREDYVRLLATLRQRGELPGLILHAWGSQDKAAGRFWRESSLQRGFYSLLVLAQAIGEIGPSMETRVVVITRGLHDITGHEAVEAYDAPVLGPCRVIPQEYSNIRCVNLDLAGGEADISDLDLEQALKVIQSAQSRDPVLAVRHGACWRETFENCRYDPVTDASTRLRHQGVYLITGGLGGVGSVLGKYLAESVQARLVLTSRSTLPPRDAWAQYLSAADPSDRICKRIRLVQELEAAGAEVWVTAADVCDESQMEDVIRQTRSRFGRLDGVIHAAGIAGGGVVQLKTRAAADSVLSPKVRGTVALGQILQDQKLDFFLLASSITSILGQIGQVDYAAGNAFLDAYARQYTRETGIRTIAINWSAWREVGMAVETEVPPDLKSELKQQMLDGGLSNADAVDAFVRILEHCDQSQVAVTLQDLTLLTEQPLGVDDDLVQEAREPSRHLGQGLQDHPRPKLTSMFQVAQSNAERTICKIWSDALGVEPIGVNDSFFDLGGHSLLAVQVMTRVNQALNSEVPVARLYEGLTVKFLAGLIEGRPTSAGSTGSGKSLQERQQQARSQRIVQQRRRSSKRKRS